MSHELTFEKTEGGKSYFKDSNNKTTVLPENYISGNLKKGDVIYLNLSKEDSVAKDILNELLDTKK